METLMFKAGSVQKILTSRQDVIAFRVDEHVSRDAALALTDHVNDLFSHADGPMNILMDMSDFKGDVLATFFYGGASESQVHSHDKVDRYAIIGSPVVAQQMVSWIDKVVPLNAQTFTTKDAERAWLFVGAEPIGVGPSDEIS